MFCSRCGATLGAVAHIVNDELVCEDCFLKITSGAHASDSAHTVLLGQHNDADRVQASRSIPSENVPEVFPMNNSAAAGNQPTPPQASATPPPFSTSPTSSVGIGGFLMPKEQILWKRTFAKGIIHREATFTELVTNLRVAVVDDHIGAVVRSAPLRGASVAVTNTRRNSSSMRTGFEHYGAYAGTGNTTSITVGDVEFLVAGKVALVFSNVRDPQGLKRLVESSIKSSRA